MQIRRALCALALLVLFAKPVHAGTVTVAWDPNPDPVAGYILFYGTASGTYTTSVDCSTATLWSVAGLIDGQQYYFALVAYNASGVQSSLSNEVTAVVAPVGAPGQLTTPAPGSTLTGSTVQFQWAAGTGVSSYGLSVGTTLGGTDIFDQPLGTSLNANVTGLPTNGGTVYVRLWSLINSVWAYQDYTYTAARIGAPGQLTTPAPRSTLTGSTVQFQWAAGTGVSFYGLSVGTTLGGTDIFDQSLGTSLNANVTGLPTNGSTVYVRLWSLISNVWAFQDYTYTAARISPALTINNVTVTAGTSGTTTATFTVTLSTTSIQTVTVAYATANGTATAGSDYVAKTGTLTFAPGVNTRTLAVTVKGDATPDADETFVVNLSSPTNAVIGGAQGVCTIHITAPRRRR